MAGKKSTFGNIELYEVGGIPFRKFGSLLQEEAEWFENQSDSQLAPLKKLLEVAKEIAVNEGISDPEAFAIVQNLNEGSNQFFAAKYAEKLETVKQSGYTPSKFNRDAAVMMINSRVPVSFLKENSGAFADSFGIEFDETYQFTSDLARKLPTKLIDDICKFASNERLEWEDLETTGLQGDEDSFDLGK